MSNQNKQREYWGQNLDTRNLGGAKSVQSLNLAEETAFYFSPEQEYALKILWGREGPRRLRILEIGCGMGVFALFLARQEADVWVVDVAPERLRFVREQARIQGLEHRIHIVCAGAENLPFSPEIFDVVYTKSVLIHTELSVAAREMHRVMKTGAKGVFVEPLRHNPFANFYRRFLGPREWKNITRYFDASRLTVLASPFDRARVKYFYFFSFAAFFWQFGWRHTGFFHFSASILNALDMLLFRLVKPLRRLAWFAVTHVQKQPPAPRGKAASSNDKEA